MNSVVAPKPFSQMPRARRRWPLASIPDVVRHGYGFLETSMEELGETFAIDLGLDVVVVVCDPEDIERVFLSEHATYTKGGPFWDAGRDAIGEGLATARGDLWRRQRRLMNPAFRKKRLDGLRAVIEQEVATHAMELESLALEGDFDVSRWTAKVLSGLTARLLVGGTLEGAEFEQFQRSLQVLVDRALQAFVIAGLPSWMPVPGAGRVERAKAFVHEAIAEVIRERRTAGSAGSHDDLLDMLLVATDDQGAMSDEQLRHEIVVTYIGGFETTAWALAWGMKLLSELPDHERRLRTSLAGSDPLQNDQLRATFLEILRLYPSVPLIPRHASTAGVLGGYQIPSGTTVIALPWLVHRNPRLWPDPLRFDPSRHLEASSRHRLSFLAFGAGQRVCIGRGLAMMEAQIVLDHVLRRYRPVPPLSHQTPEPRNIAAILAPRDGVWIRLDPVDRSTRR